MHKIIAIFVGLLLLTSMSVNAQVYVDPSFIVPAQVYAFQVDQAPTIDGDDADWADVPNSGTAYYNDRDYNGDGLPDAAPDRRDIEGSFKAVWMEGTNTLYLLLERFDDEILSDDETSWYHVDGFELRIDPMNEDEAGEPGGGNAFNIGFRVGKDEHTGIEGPLPAYEAKWMVDDSVFPTRAVFEAAFTLPTAAVLSQGYTIGFHVFFNDVDNDDNSPGTKNAALQFWPQLYDEATTAKLGVDVTWANMHSWGDLFCVKMPTVHEVNGGGAGVIQAAINAADDGDIIKVGAGEYFENIIIDKSGLRLIGTLTSSDTSKIYPEDEAVAALTIAGDDVAPDVIVKNLCFDGTKEVNQATITSTLGLSIGSVGAKIIDNVINGFVDLLDAKVGDYDYGNNIVIEGNTFYNCSGGVFFNRPNTIFRYNSLTGVLGGYGVDSKGLQLDGIIDIGFNNISDVRQCGIGWGGDGGYFAIHHNTIYRSGDERLDPTREMDDGIENQEGEASTSYIYNNTIVGWDSDGMQLNGPSSFFVRNNIVTLNDGFAFDIRNAPGELDVDFSIGIFNGKGNFDASFAGFGSSILEVDPLFVDELGDDYTLEPDSPAIDAGEADPLGFKIFYAGTKADIGAFENGVTAITSVKSNKPVAVNDYRLQQNYPNPFNPSTTIQFNIATAGHISMKIYDVNGRMVANVLDTDKQAGSHEITWNAEGFASGVYFYSLTANGINSMKKMLLVK
jgi:hypothetical protein